MRKHINRAVILIICVCTVLIISSCAGQAKIGVSNNDSKSSFSAIEVEAIALEAPYGTQETAIRAAAAGAVTVMPASGAGMPQPTEPFEMICDKPFVFILYESTYDGGNQVLFSGIVNQP